MPEHPFTNRLVNEKSPYLQQHAHNPVDWYPWGEEAFERAKEVDKPIFLSIGYATCHWCHVMERECFEDAQIAALMNENFINIKVDREEQPEIDSIYMDFAQSLMVGAAGWPLNVILTPNLEPFFATTYLPPDRRQGMMSIYDLIERIESVWNGDEKERVVDQAEKIVEIFNETTFTTGSEIPNSHLPQLGAELYFKLADSTYGGLKGVPKFPIGYQAAYLLTYSAMTKDSRSLFLVEKTLDCMCRGGIYDQVGGGFSRYSVDERWLIPHFEKMLYDNALLTQAYVQAWQVSRAPEYQKTAFETIDYILREMTDSDGGFYTAQDAETEGVEGYYYTWTYDQLQKLLPEEEFLLFCEYFNVTPDGNFNGRNVLNRPDTLEDFADYKNMSINELETQIDSARQTLFHEREKREKPFTDRKILAGWNGLMIHSLVRAGVTFERKDFLEHAVKAARFIRERLWIKGKLKRRYCEEDVQFNAGLDDYAFLIRALISLFEADQGFEWLDWAFEMSDVLETDFKEDGGAFYQTDGSDPYLILRKMSYTDGAEPSGNAVHCENLLRLYQFTASRKYLYQAEDVLKAVKRNLENYSPGYLYHLMNIMRYYDQKSPVIVIALNREEQWHDELTEYIHHRFLPHKAVIYRREGDEQLFKQISYIKDQRPIDNQTTLYICYQGVCKKPLNDLDEMLAEIKSL